MNATSVKHVNFKIGDVRSEENHFNWDVFNATLMNE